MAEKKKKKWIKAAVAEGKGAFKAKAEAAKKTTKEFAAEKASAPGKLGKEARLAETLMGMNKGKKKESKRPSAKSMRAKMYGSKE